MELKHKTLGQLADLIRKEWKKPYYGAVPYLEAMTQLENMRSTYGLDSARTIVLYFLANAQTWRGELAREVKAELKRRLEEVPRI